MNIHDLLMSITYRLTSAKNRLRDTYRRLRGYEYEDLSDYTIVHVDHFPVQGGDVTITDGISDRYDRPVTRIVVSADTHSQWKYQIPATQPETPGEFVVELVRLKHPPNPVEEMIDISGERGVLDAIVNGGSM